MLATQVNRDEARGMLADVYNWFTERFDTANLASWLLLTRIDATFHSQLDKRIKFRTESPMQNSTCNDLKKFSRRRAAFITLTVTIVIGAFIVHTAAAHMYYYQNCVRLRMAAETAVRAGGEYLPSNPQGAMAVAEASLKQSGVVAGEIVVAGISPDSRTLRIRLSVKIPTYVALFAVGLPSHEITVSASAHTQTRQIRAALPKGAATLAFGVHRSFVYWRMPTLAAGR